MPAWINEAFDSYMSKLDRDFTIQLIEIKPEKKGITIVKVQASKKPEMEMEEEEEDESEDDSEEESSIDPYSALGRLKAKMKMKKGM